VTGARFLWGARAVLAAAFGLGTIAAGWPVVPVLAFAAGVGLAATGRGVAARDVAVAAALAWTALLARAMSAPGAGAVTRTLGALGGLPPATATALAAVVTVALAALLAWSAATLGSARGHAIRRRLAPPASPPAGPAPAPITLPAPDTPAAPGSAPLGSSAAAP
jgi:hypothetical protein